MKWQILEWEIDQTTLQRMNLRLRDATGQPAQVGLPSRFGLNLYRPEEPSLWEGPGNLIETDPPAPISSGGQTSSVFNNTNNTDSSQKEATNNALGTAGEGLVVECEKRSLSENGLRFLVQKVRHVAAEEGDGAGYDVLSFGLDGNEKYIEVKTTRGTATSPFFITNNELKTSERLHADFYLYRVYEYEDRSNSGKFYILSGDMNESLHLTPKTYRVTVNA